MGRDLSDEFDLSFNRWEWRIQRVGWIVLALLLVAALAGVFGGGVLSQATARSQGEGYQVVLEYPRFGRAQSTLVLELQVRAGGLAASQLTASLYGEFIEKVTITEISPTPDSEAPIGDGVAYTWTVEDWSEPVTIRFEYEARDWRVVKGGFDLETDAGRLGRLTFKQFLFP